MAVAASVAAIVGAAAVGAVVLIAVAAVVGAAGAAAVGAVVGAATVGCTTGAVVGATVVAALEQAAIRGRTRISRPAKARERKDRWYIPLNPPIGL
jgi:hypothetical protein